MDVLCFQLLDVVCIIRSSSILWDFCFPHMGSKFVFNVFIIIITEIFSSRRAGRCWERAAFWSLSLVFVLHCKDDRRSSTGDGFTFSLPHRCLSTTRRLISSLFWCPIYPNFVFTGSAKCRIILWSGLWSFSFYHSCSTLHSCSSTSWRIFS